MGKDNLPETVERDVEVLPSIELNQGKLAAMIQFSQQTHKLGKALDSIRVFVMGRALPGDWVQHGDTINMTGPAAERMLSALGLMGVPVSFLGWTYQKDTGTDKNGDHFTWWYSADVEIGGLKLGRIEGRAGSRDKFFGYEDKAWKDLADVKEDDIRMAARRAVFKEAIKVSLGLRGIPADQAAALGLDPNKIKKVEYSKRGETKMDAAPSGTPVVIKSVETYKGTNKTTGKPYVKYYILAASGAKYATFDEKVSKLAQTLVGRKALIEYDVTQYGNDITVLRPAPDTPEDQGGDGQEPGA